MSSRVQILKLGTSATPAGPVLGSAAMLGIRSCLSDLEHLVGPPPGSGPEGENEGGTVLMAVASSVFIF